MPAEISALTTTLSSPVSVLIGSAPARADSTRARWEEEALETARPTRAQWASCWRAERDWRAPSAAAASTSSASKRVTLSRTSTIGHLRSTLKQNVALRYNSARRFAGSALSPSRERAVRCRQAGQRNPERAAARVVQADGVEERDAGRVAAVLA